MEINKYRCKYISDNILLIFYCSAVVIATLSDLIMGTNILEIAIWVGVGGIALIKHKELKESSIIYINSSLTMSIILLYMNFNERYSTVLIATLISYSFIVTLTVGLYSSYKLYRIDKKNCILKVEGIVLDKKEAITITGDKSKIYSRPMYKYIINDIEFFYTPNLAIKNYKVNINDIINLMVNPNNPKEIYVSFKDRIIEFINTNFVILLMLSHLVTLLCYIC